MTRTVYRLTTWNTGGIESLEHVRDTEKMHVFLLHRRPPRPPQEVRELKRESYPLYNTWAEAHAALLARQRARIERHRDALAQAESYLGELAAMKDPTQ